MHSLASDLKRWTQQIFSLRGAMLLILLLPILTGTALGHPFGESPSAIDFDIDVYPWQPTTEDYIRIELSGTWPDTCVPRYSHHSISGHQIEIWGQVSLETAPGSQSTSPNDIRCDPIPTRWSFTVYIGQLEEGWYTVYGRIIDLEGHTHEETTNFEVIAPACEIWGKVYEDADRNGECDRTEPRLPFVTVRLLDEDEDEVDTYRTGYNGQYEFTVTDIESGDVFYVVETDSPGYTSVNSNRIRVEVEAGERIEAGDFCDIRVEATPTPTATSTPSPTPTPTPTPPTHFAGDQVVVTGARDELEQVIDAVSETVTLTLVERIDLGYMSDRPLVMDLYGIADGTPVEQVVALINQQAADLGFDVFADPNYLTGRPPTSATGDPWFIEGSPAGGSVNAARELFRNQWAFGENGIDLFTGENRSIPYTGADVRIGVFDTSPFVTLGEKLFEGVPLTVAHPNPVVTLTPPPGAPDVSDHGLFAAGLVHAVVPDSDIHLIRVLNDYGQGDLFTLGKALDTFIRDAIADSGTLAGSVINLSLGVHQPPNPGELGLPEEVVALETIIFGAERLGLVVVAAAGNDSDDTTVQPMQIPAAYPVVIGVSAGNSAGGRACFSNRGDVAAPGGDGSRPGCAPMVHMCSSQPEYCSISLARASDTNHAYWTGTSFSTPLVAGLAALVLEKENGAVSPTQVAAAIYRGARPAEDALGAGVIHLQHTLLPSSIYLPVVINGMPP